MKTTQKIWLSSPHMSGEEMKYIGEAFRNNHVFPLGPNVTGLENDIMQFTGAKACTCLASGTSAIHLALILLGVGSEDEVFCSTFTFSASANPIVYQGATPVFIDSEPTTWNMSPELLEKALAERKPSGKMPKAIILVHLYGMPARIDEIMEIARRYQVPVIEDAAESLGSTFDGQATGTFGEMGILSFNGNKIITTSGGGALISNKADYCRKALFLATQARDAAPHYQHSHIGYNYRMSNICAGIGRGQMEVIAQRVAKRRENFEFYRENLGTVEGISFQTAPDDRFFSNHWLTAITIDPDLTLGVNREKIYNALNELDIETRPLWKPMHLQPIFEKFPAYLNGTSNRLFDLGLCLPSSSNITEAERQKVVEAITETIQRG
ncbi:MAG: DegT/DnrJ/EryC1/StrS family aminotransferase [Lentimicrobium sp.]|jgi:dTDP-4-amino-4,6-dideoxygalactose transaminase|nr:DegT/DnrJ/EryC1/StrS family aminotransferase [Lentimicrobium sp.]